MIRELAARQHARKVEREILSHPSGYIKGVGYVLAADGDDKFLVFNDEASWASWQIVPDPEWDDEKCREVEDEMVREAMRHAIGEETPSQDPRIRSVDGVNVLVAGNIVFFPDGRYAHLAVTKVEPATGLADHLVRDGSLRVPLNVTDAEAETLMEEPAWPIEKEGDNWFAVLQNAEEPSNYRLVLAVQRVSWCALEWSRC